TASGIACGSPATPCCVCGWPARSAAQALSPRRSRRATKQKAPRPFGAGLFVDPASRTARRSGVLLGGLLVLLLLDVDPVELLAGGRARGHPLEAVEIARTAARVAERFALVFNHAGDREVALIAGLARALGRGEAAHDDGPLRRDPA